MSPGQQTSEYRTVKHTLIGAAVTAAAGAVVGLFVASVGIALVVASALVAGASIVGYSLSRGRVKAAREANRPPPSRNF